MNNAGQDVVTIVNQDKWGDLACVERKDHMNLNNNVDGINSTMLMQKTE